MVGVIASVTTGRFGLSVWSFWNRVPTVPSPGVASADPADRQPRSPGRTVYLEGLHRIGRTGRDEPARRRTSGTNRLVSDDQGTQDAGEESHRAAPWSWRSRLFSKLVTSSLNWAGLRSTAPGLSDTSSAPGEPGSGFLEDGADPSPETVAHHGRSNLPGDGKSDPRPGLDIGRSR